MGFGTTFYERAVSLTQGESHLQALTEGNIKGVEFTVSEQLMPISETARLIRMAQELGLETAFHSPDFLQPRRYSLTHLRDTSGMIEHYLRLFSFIADHSEQRENMVVLHSACYRDRLETDAENLSHNQKALDRLLNLVIQKQMPIKLCLENTSFIDEVTQSHQPAFLEAILATFKEAPLGLCLDLAHWYRSIKADSKRLKTHQSDPLLGLSPMLLDQIAYSHLHGFSEDLKKSHLPLKPEHSEYLSFVKAFSQNKNQIILNLEMFDFPAFENIDTYEKLIFEQFQIIENF